MRWLAVFVGLALMVAAIAAPAGATPTRTDPVARSLASAPAAHAGEITRTPPPATESAALPGHASQSAGIPGAVVSPTSLSFGLQRVGTYGSSKTITFRNTGTANTTITKITVSTIEIFGHTDCDVVAPGRTCTATVYFAPSTVGKRTIVLSFVDDAPNAPQHVTATGTGIAGYYLGDSLGGIAWFGDATFHGQPATITAPLIAFAPSVSNGEGYLWVGRDGSVYTFGNVVNHGSLRGKHLNQPIVGVAQTTDGRGYWLVARDGGIFGFGNAHFYGSMGGKRLNQPIVGMAATPDGHGYWLVARDGGMFGFGDAHFHGSTGSIKLSAPIMGMAAMPTGHGYWLFASDGGLFGFGDARFHGSPAHLHLRQPVVGMAPTSNGQGYWMVTRTGQVFGYGNAPWLGDAPSIHFQDNLMIGIAATTPPLDPALL
jgi:hypothetical protein